MQNEQTACAFCGGEADDYAALQMRIEISGIAKARNRYPLCYTCARDTKGSEIVSRIAPDTKALAEAAHTLAMLGLQSSRYSTDGEFRGAADNVLALSRLQGGNNGN